MVAAVSYREQALAATAVQRTRWTMLGQALAAKEALDDPAVFFELVMRDEVTHRPVTVAPHQRVMFSFLLHHERSVFILPVGLGKTFTLAGLALWFIARDPSVRIMIIGASQEQAKRVLIIIRQYLESSRALRLVNRALRRSSRPGEPWSDTLITVDRAAYVRDPTVAAYGLDSKSVMGKRVEVVLVDDLLTPMNCATPEGRDQTFREFFAKAASRAEPGSGKSRVIAVNSMMHPDDYLNRLAGPRGWPTLRASVLGDVWVSNADPAWDTEHLTFVDMPDQHTEHCRLAVRAPGEPIWPERYSREAIEAKRLEYVHIPGEFNRQFLSDARDDSSALCKIEFVERCKKLARDDRIYGLVDRYMGDDPTFTGVDLAATPEAKKGADRTVFFTFAIRQEDGARIILDIESGFWDASVIIDKLFLKIDRYRSYAVVENNATQKLLVQMAQSMKRDLPIRGHTTTDQGKAHPWFGVIGVFYEMSKGYWRIPNDASGVCPPEVAAFVRACLYYSPERHTSDYLMASYVAREFAGKLGLLVRPEARSGGGGGLTAAQRALMR